MITKKILANKIKALRELEGFSQEVLAHEVNLSRVAISQIEQGNRNIDFLELVKIAQFFKLKTDYFLIEDELPIFGLKKEDVSVSDFDPNKLKNIILYILEKCAGKPNLGETVLYKLLYFIDFDSFEVKGQSVSGLNYIHLQYGPVPLTKQYSPVIEEMLRDKELQIIRQNYYGLKIKRYINLTTCDINALSYGEVRIIDDVIASLSGMSASQIESYSHGDAPWKLSGDKEVIPYNLVFKRKLPYVKRLNDDLTSYEANSAVDVLHQLGSISKDEYNYYEKL